MKKIIALTMSAVVATSMFCGLTFADEADAAAVEVVEETTEETAEGAVEETIEVSLSEEGEIVLEDYTPVEVSESSVSVTQDEIDSLTSTVVSYYTTNEVVSEGTVENGDNVNIDFSGVAEGDTEPFEGGTAEGYDITLGSGAFIEGFEEQIVGHSIGETFDINVTFPEEYAEELAGRNAVFTITINYKTVVVVPELTDELVQQFAAEYLGIELNSVDELNEYSQGLLYDEKIYSAILDSLVNKAEITSYKEAYYNAMKEYALASLSSYEAYGIDADTFAMLSGYSSADEYASEQAANYAGIFMVLDKAAADLGITQETLDAEFDTIRTNMGFDDLSLEEFKALYPAYEIYMVERGQIEYTLVLDALKEQVVIVPDAETGTVVTEVE